MGSRSRCDAQRESGQNGYANSYRILKTILGKKRVEWAKALIKYMVARCATHFPVPCEAIPAERPGFDYPCADDHMIAR
jgi:hypothetical protein